MSDISQTLPRKRAKVFSSLENEMVIQEVEKRRGQLLGKFSPSVTKISKEENWCEIANLLNAQCGNNRNGKEVEKRWYNIQSTAVREIDAHQKAVQQTGGGPAPKEPSLQTQRVVDTLISPEKLIGVQGGIDSFESVVFESEKTDVPLEVVELDLDTYEGSSTPAAGPSKLDTILGNLKAYKSKGEPKANRASKRSAEVQPVQPEIAELIQLEKAKVLKSDDEKKLDLEIKEFQLKKLKLEVRVMEESHVLTQKLKEKELEKLQADINVLTWKAELLQYDVSLKEATTLVVEQQTEQMGQTSQKEQFIIYNPQIPKEV